MELVAERRRRGGRLKHLKRNGAILLFAALIAASDADAEDANSRLIREAKQIFALARAGDAAPQPCEYSVFWAQDPVPEYVARANFGTNLHAGLSSPDAPAPPKDILDPQGQNTAAFCTPAERQRYEEEQINSLATGRKDIVVLKQATFTFPLFDADFRKAALVVSHSEIGRARISAKNNPLQFVSTIFIFVKAKGAWRWLKTVPNWQT